MLKKSMMLISIVLTMGMHAAGSESPTSDEVKQLQEEMKKIAAEVQQIKECVKWTKAFVKCTIKNPPLLCIRSFAEMSKACGDDEK